MTRPTLVSSTRRSSAWVLKVLVGAENGGGEVTLKLLRGPQHLGGAAAVDEQGCGAENLFREVIIGQQVVGVGLEQNPLCGEALGAGSALGGSERGALAHAVLEGAGDALCEELKGGAFGRRRLAAFR